MGVLALGMAVVVDQQGVDSILVGAFGKGAERAAEGFEGVATGIRRRVNVVWTSALMTIVVRGKSFILFRQ